MLRTEHWLPATLATGVLVFRNAIHRGLSERSACCTFVFLRPRYIDQETLGFTLENGIHLSYKPYKSSH